jgi:hypothetical protein
VSRSVDTFALRPGRRIGRRYRVERLLGAGTEGEVYRICEDKTGVRLAAKIFFPQRDPHRRLSVAPARKLHRLRDCPIVLQYFPSDLVTNRAYTTTAVLSAGCVGAPLERGFEGARGQRWAVYPAMVLLRELASGLEQIHGLGQYHSDVHTENILVTPRGVRLELKLIDFYEWGRPTRAKMREDIVQAVRVFYDVVGGAAHYAKLPPVAKNICCGLKRSLILERFPTASSLRVHLETFHSDPARYPI